MTVASRLQVVDPAGDRRVLATQFADGRITVRDRHLNGSARVLAADVTRNLAAASGISASRATRGELGIRTNADAVDLDAPATTVTLGGLPFRAARADGACDLVTHGRTTRVRTGPDGAVTLRPGAGNSAPAADPGRSVENAPIGWLQLDGRGELRP